MKRFYSVEDSKNSAKALAKSLPVSRKHSIEIANSIRFKDVKKAKLFLANVVAMKEAVPFTRFNWNVGHRKGNLSSGRYPIKAAQAILTLLSSAESNASSLGLSSEDLVISHIAVKQGPNTWRYGRQRRRQAKRTHVEIVVSEKKEETLKVKQKSKEKPAEKTDAKSTPAADVTKAKPDSKVNAEPASQTTEKTK